MPDNLSIQAELQHLGINSLDKKKRDIPGKEANAAPARANGWFDRDRKPGGKARTNSDCAEKRRPRRARLAGTEMVMTTRTRLVHIGIRFQSIQ